MPRPSNFSFLAAHHGDLASFGTFAERYFADDPNTCLVKLRQFGELLAQLVMAESGLYKVAGETQAKLLVRLKQRRKISPQIADLLHKLRDIGNEAVHNRLKSKRLALSHLQYAHQLGIWFHKTFSEPDFEAPAFIPPPEGSELDAETQAELARLQQQAQANLAAAESAQAVAAEEAALRQEAEAKAKELEEQLKEVATQAKARSPQEAQKILQRGRKFAEELKLNEADIRQKLDEQLRQLGWEAETSTLRYSKGTRPEVGKNLAIAEWPLNGNRVDYALFVDGDLMGVLEAKASDPAKAETQVETYVKDAKEKHGIKPFAFFSDYYTTYFWDVGVANKRLVSSTFSPEDLKRLHFICKHRSPLASVRTNLDIVDRTYQLEAIQRIGDAFEQGQRRALLVMATGTGKTRTAMALIEKFLQTSQAQKILFVADRKALVRQALNKGFKAQVVLLMVLKMLLAVLSMQRVLS